MKSDARATGDRAAHTIYFEASSIEKVLTDTEQLVVSRQTAAGVMQFQLLQRGTAS